MCRIRHKIIKSSWRLNFSAYSGQISSPCNNKVHSDSHTLLQEKQSEVASIQLLTMNNTIIFVHMIGENPVLLPSCDKPPDLTPAGQKTKPNRESLKKKKKKNRRRRSRGNSPGAGEGVCASELSRTPQKVNTNTRSEAPQTPDIVRRAETIDWREEEEQTNVCVCVCVCEGRERGSRRVGPG